MTAGKISKINKHYWIIKVSKEGRWSDENLNIIFKEYSKNNLDDLKSFD